MSSQADSIEKLKIEWTKQLYKEHSTICYAYELKLRPPLIVIMDFRSRWGHWDPLSRTLALSFQLILKHSWSTVLEIFKHEIAHQVVSELFQQEDQHGPFFRQACLILGVESWAQRAEVHTIPDLADLQHRVLSEKESLLLRRVEKLLALAQSPNEHEAHAAMKKVSELYETYNLETIETRENEEFATISITHRTKRIPYFHSQIASILTGYFNVRLIFANLYDPEVCTAYKSIDILGRPENVKLAEYVYWFLFNNLRLLWETYKETVSERGLVAKHSYYSGVLSGFEETLRLQKAQRQSPPSNCAGLITQEHARLKDFVSSKFPRLVNVRSGGRKARRSTYEAGLKQGKALVLHQGVKGTHAGQGGPHLIE